MKAIVTIGYVNLLVPDTKTATKLMELLAATVQVEDRMYEGRVVLCERENRLEMKVVPESTRYVRRREGSTVEEELAPAPANAKRLGAGTRRQLRLLG